jgi:hypothetical protein
MPQFYSKEANIRVEIVKHALEALQGKLGTMQATLHEVQLEREELCE